MKKFRFLTLSLFITFITVNYPFLAAIAQLSKGTAGFSSGAGTTTTNNTVFSMPANLGNQDTNESTQTVEDPLSNFSQGNNNQREISRIVTDPPAIIYTEQFSTRDFQRYLNLSPRPEITLAQTKSFLRKVNAVSGINPALIYISFSTPPIIQTASNVSNTTTQPNNELQILIVTQAGALPIIAVPGVTYEEMLKVVRKLENNLSNKTEGQDFLPQASQLYEWIIFPIQQQLQKQKIDSLSFVLDSGLRTLPIAALYNAQTNQFVIENYSVSLMPSLSLTDLTPRARQDINNSQVLAMGADSFPDQKPLPAVPFELSEITQKLLTGEIFLNKNFTVDNFKKAFETQKFNIVHLATHGEFKSGSRANSYIYFSDQKLNLDQFSALGLDSPKVDLLVLSACKTALGDPQAELGFAGLAVKTGVRTALGSLWYVSDEGTLALMALFYNQLKTAQTKTEALRKAQLALLNGKYEIVGQELILDGSIRLTLSPQLLNTFKQNLRHPYYWSAFTLIGNPW